jgi:hypothetical protein
MMQTRQGSCNEAAAISPEIGGNADGAAVSFHNRAAQPELPEM